MTGTIGLLTPQAPGHPHYKEHEDTGIEKLAAYKSHGGVQQVFSHRSAQTGTEMRFGVYLPPQAEHGRLPVLYWLSGLTCTEMNFIEKAGAQRVAAELGLIIVTPDTSPRGLHYPGEDDTWDFGTGAGFYVDATESPWVDGYRMYSYINEELPALIAGHFPADPKRSGIFGHSMGGHGALTIALKNPQRFRTVSAFAPICSPMNCPWGEKALGGYLGITCEKWRSYDACELLKTQGWAGPPILVEQGSADKFMAEQLKPELLQAACDAAGVALQLNLREGYDHSYFFIASFVENHLRFHARHLG